MTFQELLSAVGGLSALVSAVTIIASWVIQGRAIRDLKEELKSVRKQIDELSRETQERCERYRGDCGRLRAEEVATMSKAIKEVDLEARKADNELRAALNAKILATTAEFNNRIGAMDGKLDVLIEKIGNVEGAIFKKTSIERDAK